jgi:hypothetical protein
VITGAFELIVNVTSRASHSKHTEVTWITSVEAQLWRVWVVNFQKGVGTGERHFRE